MRSRNISRDSSSRNISRDSSSAPALSLPDLEYQVEGWIYDGQARQLSAGTIANRRRVSEKLLWFLRHRELAICGPHELRAFLAYLNTGHEETGGRWGEGEREDLRGFAASRGRQPLRPGSVKLYHTHLRGLMNWIVEEGVLDESPMARLAAPVSREDQIEPFAALELYALLDAAERSQHPERDVAIVRFLYDTGVRASELCALTVGDLEIHAQKVTVRGKGGKSRAIYYGTETRRALWKLLGPGVRDLHRDTPLFRCLMGATRGQAMAPSTLLHLLHALGKRANVPDCHPHRFRHSFAVAFLKAGGNQFSLMQLLGHTSLTVTSKYVKLAQADLEAQHRAFSPGDQLRPRNRRK